MRRDPVLGEQVLWRGSPRTVALTTTTRLVFWTLALLSAMALATAIAAASTLAVPVRGMIFFAGWCAMFAMAVRVLPRHWHTRAEILVTDQRVIWRRGRFGRSIERAGITFARIRWYASEGEVGDLELVRAVPTGALRRRLTVVLRGVHRPDKLWDLIRTPGSETAPASARQAASFLRAHAISDAPPASLGPRPLGQRLQPSERIEWSGRPIETWRRFIPRARRNIAGALLGAACFFALARAGQRAAHALHQVLEAGVASSSVGFIALVTAMSLSALLLLGMGAALLWSAVIEPGLLVQQTRYLITNQRVLIVQGREELQLDRAHIVDVIDAPAEAGGHDLFLVLDGPRARGLAVSDAFQRPDTPELQPVLRQLPDAEQPERLLRTPAPQPA